MRLILFCIISNLVLTACITKIVPRVSIHEFDDRPSLLKNPPSPLVSELFVRLQLDYIEVNRLKPDAMLISAFHQLDNAVPEINIQLKQGLEDAKSPILAIQTSVQDYQIPVSDLSDLSDLNLTLQQTLNLLKKDLPQSKWVKAEQAIVKGILATLDPHSSAIFTAQYQNFQERVQGQFGGIGVVVQHDAKKGLKILQVIRNSPAYTSGLKSGEWITEIDDESVKSMDRTSAKSQLQGLIGTPVKLKILKADQSKYHVNLPRAIIHAPSVEVERIQSKILLIQIKVFQQNTVAQLYDALSQTEGIEGIILDIRDNLGGLLQQAALTANFFLPPNKKITSTEGTLEQAFVSQWILKDQRLNTIPLAILINRVSASGSEIVASALKERPNTVLLGERTFGKGSVQHLQAVGDIHGLKLTVAKYLTPNGDSIQAVGEVPHIKILPIYWDQTYQKFLVKSYPPREENLARVFKWGEPTTSADFELQYLQAFGSNQSLTKIFNFLPSYDPQMPEDFVKDFAVKSLKQISNVKDHLKKDDLKEIALALAKQVQVEEEQKMLQVLKDSGINWGRESGFVSEPDVNFQVSWEESDVSTNLSKDGHTFRLRWSLQSQNDALDRLKMRVRVLNQPGPIWELPIGRLEANKTISQEQELLLPYREAFRLQAQLLDEKERVLSKHDKIVIPKPVEAPKLKVQFAIRDNGDWGSRGNGNGVVEPDEKIALRINISNHGSRATGKLRATLKPKHTIKSIRQTGRLPKLKSGETGSMTMLYTTKQKSALFIDQLDLSDSLFQSNHLSYRLNLTQAEHLQNCCDIPEVSLKVLEKTEDGQVKIQAKIMANETIQSALLARNEKKIAFFHLQKKTFDEQKKVNLQKGFNRFSITVTTQHGLTLKKSLTLWHPYKPL